MVNMAGSPTDTKLARALYTNTPESKNELFFRKGDLLTVLQFDYQGQHGWWLCTLLGERGICPGNYLELLEHDYQNTGEDIPSYDVPRKFEGGLRSSTILNPLDLYDVPKRESPIYNSAASVRSKKQGSDSYLNSAGSSNRVSSASSAASSIQSASSTEPSFLPSRSQKLARPESPIYANENILHEFKRFSKESATPSVEPEFDYDIPRSSLTIQGHTSSPKNSYMSASCRNAGLANPDTKESLDLYDIPRSAKNCANLFETKYDHVQHRRRTPDRNDQSKRSSIYSNASSNDSLNPQSSIEKHFGVILRNAGSLQEADTISRSSSRDGYDIPPRPRSSRPQSIQSLPISTSSNIDQSTYDMPTGFSRQVSISSFSDAVFCDGASSLKNSTWSSTNLAKTASKSSIPHMEQESAHVEVKFLPLCPKAAVTVCEKLRQEVITSINSILALHKPKWRLKENLKEIMPDLRFGCVRLNLGLKDFTEFCSRTVSNAKKFEIQPLVIRLQKLLAPLTNGSQIIQRDVDELEAYCWSVDRLSVSVNEKEGTNDALDQLLLCARSLQYDVTEISNFIALKSTALFGETSAPKEKVNRNPEPECTVEDTQEDYDYVTLSSAEETNKIPNAQIEPSKLNPLNSTDQQILDFYSAQIASTAPLLSQSISTFISSVHQNEPPKAFNGHLKYVILLAYKMLFAGDTIHRNVSNEEIKANVEEKADDLHKAVVALHEASKLATRDFPKVLPMQNIIEHVWQTTSAAAQLKKIIFNATL